MSKLTTGMGDRIDTDVLQQLVDRQAILDCLTRYARGIDRLDRALMLSAYHAGAVNDHGDYVGAAEGLFDVAHRAYAGDKVSTHHRLTNHSCEIQGDVAHTETYYLYTAVKPGNVTITTASGRYIDKLERRERKWGIVTRYCVVEWAGSISATESPFANVTDVHLNGVPSHGRGDPSYLRPLVNKRPLSQP